MAHEFDRAYWDDIWAGAGGSVGDDDGDRPAAMAANPPNPHLIREVSRLVPGTALEAGCGAGTEALWLASQGWQVTGADFAAEALTIAARRSAELGLSGRVSWVEADLSAWEPPARYDLVTTHYAHPAIPQLDFYERLAGWVAPRGTLLIVGHLNDAGHGRHGGHVTHAGHDRGAHPPAEAGVTAASVTARLEADRWEIVTAEEASREMPGHGGAPVAVHDVVVTATRRP